MTEEATYEDGESAFSQSDIDSSDVDTGERTEDFQEMKPENLKKCKISVFVILMGVFITLVIVPTLELATVDCMQDKFQDKLQHHYDYFKANAVLRDRAMIASGLLIDGLLLSYMVLWVYKGGSFRFIISLALIYLIRWNCGWWAIIHPKGGNQWQNPGLTSLTVQYNTCNNQYYFNPVVGFLTALYAEFRVEK